MPHACHTVAKGSQPMHNQELIDTKPKIYNDDEVF